MEINLFSKCIKELIVVNDKVEVPYLGTFTAEMMPASYSDRQTTIHPPYRKMTFHKGAVSLSDGRMLLDKVRQELGVSLDQAGVELGWCLSRLSSELEGRKICRLPGLGVMRANARNEFFFVPDDDLDIWPDGLGFEPISIKMPKEQQETEAASTTMEEIPVQAGQDEIPEPRNEMPVQAGQEAVVRKQKRKLPVWAVLLIVLGTLLLLFVAASYLFTEQMSPILDRLLYTKEELELLRGR